MERQAFTEALAKTKIPILVLTRNGTGFLP